MNRSREESYSSTKTLGKRCTTSLSESIKEISLFFDFPNVSFFTKYVKKNLGMTPTEFRNKKEEASE